MEPAFGRMKRRHARSLKRQPPQPPQPRPRRPTPKSSSPSRSASLKKHPGGRAGSISWKAAPRGCAVSTPATCNPETIPRVKLPHSTLVNDPLCSNLHDLPGHPPRPSFSFSSSKAFFRAVQGYERLRKDKKAFKSLRRSTQKKTAPFPSDYSWDSGFCLLTPVPVNPFQPFSTFVNLGRILTLPPERGSAIRVHQCSSVVKIPASRLLP